MSGLLRRELQKIVLLIVRLNESYDRVTPKHPDERRKFRAAVRVTDGPASALLTAARLDGPRASHSIFEGYPTTAEALEVLDK